MNIDKFKVVCIVKNDSTALGDGLRNTFNRNTNDFIKKYFYSVNGDNIIFSNEFGNQTRNKFLLINKNLVIPKEKLTKEDKWEILLVCENFVTFLSDLQDSEKNIIFTPDTLVMYHQIPLDSRTYLETLQRERKIHKCKQGQHINSPNEGYQRLFALTIAWNNRDENCNENYKFNPSEYDEAKKNIIEWFGVNDKLNAALEFLHECIGGDPKISTLNSDDYNEEEWESVYTISKKINKEIVVKERLYLTKQISEIIIDNKY